MRVACTLHSMHGRAVAKWPPSPYLPLQRLFQALDERLLEVQDLGRVLLVQRGNHELRQVVGSPFSTRKRLAWCRPKQRVNIIHI